MIDVLFPTSHTYTHQILLNATVFQLKIEDRSLDGIEQWRKRAPLAYAARGFEEGCHSTIDKGCDPRLTYTCFHPTNERQVETKVLHNLEKKGVPNSVKRIS